MFLTGGFTAEVVGALSLAALPLTAFRLQDSLLRPLEVKVDAQEPAQAPTKPPQVDEEWSDCAHVEV